MLTSDGFEDSKHEATVIKDFSEKTVEDFLKSVYNETLEKDDFTPELLLIAEKYDFKKLIQNCQDYLSKALDSENAFEILKVAYMTNQDSLMKRTLNFLMENPSNFISNEWSQIVKTYPLLCDTLRQIK